MRVVPEVARKLLDVLVRGVDDGSIVWFTYEAITDRGNHMQVKSSKKPDRRALARAAEKRKAS